MSGNDPGVPALAKVLEFPRRTATAAPAVDGSHDPASLGWVGDLYPAHREKIKGLIAEAVAAAVMPPAPAPEPEFQLTPPMLRIPRKPRDPNKPPRRRKPPVSLSDEQFLALLGKAKEHRLRDWVLILFTYRHGFRASEPLGVTEADIDLRDGKVFVRRGKGSEGGWQDLMSWPENPLMDERGALEFWLANRGKFGVKGGAKPGARKRSPARALTGEGGDHGKEQNRPDDPRDAEGTHERDNTPAKMQQSTKIVAFSPEAANTDHFSPGFEGAPDEKPAGGSKPLPPSSDDALGAFTAPQPPSERLFPISRSQFWRLVHKYALAAGIPPRKCKTHTLKHTIAKNLIRAGHPPNEVMEWMGWRSMETMMWYIRPDEEELGQRISDRMRGMTGLRSMAQGRLFP